MIMYGVKCNVRAPHRFLRFDARCWVTLTNPGWGGERIQVVGMSRGGRMVCTWIDARDLHNFRAGWVPADHTVKPVMAWDAREEAQAWADSMNTRYGAEPVRPHACNWGFHQAD